MDCNAFEEQIGDYLEQGLPPEQRRAFSEHLLSCSACRTLFDDIRENIELCRRTSSITRSGYGEKEAMKIHFLPPSGVEIKIANPTIGEMISCRSFDTLIGDYFETSLTDSISGPLQAIDSAEQVADHLIECAACATLFEGLRQASETSAVDWMPDDREHAQLEARILAVTAGTRH